MIITFLFLGGRGFKQKSEGKNVSIIYAVPVGMLALM
jgi:hypothetical protein